MRVITGSARGRKLSAPPGLDTRPTSEMVKEAVFSMIQFETEGARVLDLFAGSGQMGIEALSRGAKSCVFVDSSREAFQAVKGNLENTGFADSASVIRTDVFLWLQSARESFDIAFLDPPYGQKLAEKALPLIAGLMSAGGVIICEAAAGEGLPDNAGEFAKYREYRYGRTVIAQYRTRSE